MDADAECCPRSSTLPDTQGVLGLLSSTSSCAPIREPSLFGSDRETQPQMRTALVDERMDGCQAWLPRPLRPKRIGIFTEGEWRCASSRHRARSCRRVHTQCGLDQHRPRSCRPVPCAAPSSCPWFSRRMRSTRKSPRALLPGESRAFACPSCVFPWQRSEEPPAAGRDGRPVPQEGDGALPGARGHGAQRRGLSMLHVGDGSSS